MEITVSAEETRGGKRICCGMCGFYVRRRKSDTSEIECLREEDIVALRPAKGISPNKKFLIINKKSAKNLKKGTLINLKNLIINKKI